MNKKFILSFITILITSFLFCGDVNAAQELTCLYKQRLNDTDKVMLIQESDGTLSVFKNASSSAGLDSDGWYKAKTVPRWYSRMQLIEKGSLTECPPSAMTMSNPRGRVVFEDEKQYCNILDRYNCLEKTWKSVKKPVATYYENNSEIVAEKNTICSDITKENLWISPFDENGKYLASCLYYANVDEGCLRIQLDVDKMYNLHWTHRDPDPEPGRNRVEGDPHAYQITTDTTSFNITRLMSGNYAGECPQQIYVKREKSYKQNVTTVSIDKTNGTLYVIGDSAGKNVVTGELLKSSDLSNIDFEDVQLTCEDVFGENRELGDLIKFVYNMIKFAIPIILFALSVVDFVKVIFSGNEDDMKKVTKKFITRLLIAVGIFLIELLLKFILGIAYDIWGILDPTLCGVLD